VIDTPAVRALRAIGLVWVSADTVLTNVVGTRIAIVIAFSAVVARRVRADTVLTNVLGTRVLVIAAHALAAFTGTALPVAAVLPGTSVGMRARPTVAHIICARIAIVAVDSTARIVRVTAWVGIPTARVVDVTTRVGASAARIVIVAATVRVPTTWIARVTARVRAVAAGATLATPVAAANRISARWWWWWWWRTSRWRCTTATGVVGLVAIAAHRCVIGQGDQNVSGYATRRRLRLGRSGRGDIAAAIFIC